MLFTSPSYFVFFAIVFLCYWRLGLGRQNFLLLVASYVFYAWWDWRFLGLLLASSLLDFFLGRLIDLETNQISRRLYLLFVIAGHLTVLFFFKYYDFFTESFSDLFSVLGISSNPATIKIILPVGISFYTFQSMSYSLDVFLGRFKSTTNLLGFLTYVSFFPLLLAGPIERATNLLTQFNQRRFFAISNAVDGVRQITWGLFKKVVIADNLAVVVNSVYGNVAGAAGGDLLVATAFFAFQLYCDFSGYSDMAIGSSKLLGFKLLSNFNYPYFSRSISEFWRKWHISLSTWIRDYVYYPIAFLSPGSSRVKIYVATVISFILVGLWHGAGWNFVFMGVIFSFYLVIELLIGDVWIRSHRSRKNTPGSGN